MRTVKTVVRSIEYGNSGIPAPPLAEVLEDDVVEEVVELEVVVVEVLVEEVLV